MNQPDDTALEQQLAKLARDVAPARDLWIGIENRLLQRPRQPAGRWRALAAGLAAASIASALIWAVMQARPAANVATLTAREFEELRSPRYTAARASLEASFKQCLERLDPATRTKIEASLNVIRQAHEDIRQALLQHPESPVLQQLWQSTWHDELDLYENVVQATQPTLMRI